MMPSQPFPIITVPGDASEQSESLGTKPKFWYRDSDQYPVLFKEARPGTGEDWSEKIACELCVLLGIPHAHYDLASWKGINGIITRNCCPKDGTLIHGNEILRSLDESYPKGSESDEKVFYRVSQHTLDKVIEVLEEAFFRPPLELNLSEKLSTATQVFVGYLMLDAWIGNTDRHHQNWAIIHCNSEYYLSPTFDHASCLGRNENDDRRKERLSTKDSNYSVKAYVDKCTSAFYNRESDRKPMKTIEAFKEAAERDPQAAMIWLSKLEQISIDDVVNLFHRIPAERISPVAVEFALEMLKINKIKLLDLRNELR